jgi:hypothetical protein
VANRCEHSDARPQRDPLLHRLAVIGGDARDDATANIGGLLAEWYRMTAEGPDLKGPSVPRATSPKIASTAMKPCRG